MSEIAKCGRCGADWHEGAFSENCETCGGGALERPCPTCFGLCGAYWSRALLDSNDSGMAHWHGTCASPGIIKDIARYSRAGVHTTWWLDDSALPSLLWACLLTADDSRTVILDLNGAAHPFPDPKAAVAWLREDEYDCLTDLRFSGQVALDVRPPAAMVSQAADLLRRTWL